MKPNKEELEKIKEDVRTAFLAEVKRRTVERLLHDNAERLDRYYQKTSSELTEDLIKDFPL